MINCKQGNTFELIKEVKDLSIDIVFADPPYAMGSKLETKNYTEEILKAIKENKVDPHILSLIENNNKLDIKGSGSEFMSKWEAPKGKDWQIFFENSFRILKHGGYCILYGLEEVGALYNYYASMAGFETSLSLYYCFGSSFPKNLNLSKAVDSRLGVERTQSVVREDFAKRSNKNSFDTNAFGIQGQKGVYTLAESDLVKKYEGYHAGIKPLKSNTEIIYVFHKPCKYKSYIDDLMAYENGEKDIHVSAWWIDGNRIEYSKDDHVLKYDGYSNDKYESEYEEGTSYKHGTQVQINTSGRYPSNLIFDETMAERLDEQSGELKSGDNCFRRQTGNGYHGGFNGIGNEQRVYGDEGGASRFFEVISYLDPEIEKFIWSSKVSKWERNAGLESLDNKERFGQGNYSMSPICSICGKTQNGINDHSSCMENPEYKLVYERTEENSVQKNIHPTLKSLELNRKILNLCKSPNRENETILFPFAGVFSEVIGGVAAGFKEENVIAFELLEEYIEIGKLRYEFWKDNNFTFGKDGKAKIEKKERKVKEKTIDKSDSSDYNNLI
jgi:site-specific DNA-methyltransferase (adenine-specific)